MLTWHSHEGLPESVAKTFLPFARKLIDLYGEEVQSIFLFGSASGENFIPKRSDINSAIVLTHVGVPELTKAQGLVNSVRRLRIQAPLFLTKAHIRSSLDVFPIEFMDMQNRYVVVYGQDFLKDLVIQTEHVRLFCEQQIKGKLIRIRQAFLEVGMTTRGMEHLLRDALDSLIPVFRGLLKTRGTPPASRKEDVLRQMGKAFGIEADAFLTIWQNKTQEYHLDKQRGREVLGAVLQQLDRLAEAIDQL